MAVGGGPNMTIRLGLVDIWFMLSEKMLLKN